MKKLSLVYGYHILNVSKPTDDKQISLQTVKVKLSFKHLSTLLGGSPLMSEVSHYCNCSQVASQNFFQQTSIFKCCCTCMQPAIFVHHIICGFLVVEVTQHLLWPFYAVFSQLANVNWFPCLYVNQLKLYLFSFKPAKTIENNKVCAIHF